MKPMTFSAPSTMRYGVMVWNPSGIGFALAGITYSLALNDPV
jgi:hypothetical protein